MNKKGHPWWKPKLDRKITSRGGSQMTRKWVLRDLEYAVTKETRIDILSNGYESILIGVSKERPMIIESLDKNAKVIANNITEIN
ncbi:hypothetical protein ACKUSY_12840 [Myroides odoratus]